MVVIGANFSPDGLTPEAQTESSEPSRGVARWIKRWWTGAGNRIKELETRVKQMWRTRPNLKPSVPPTSLGELDGVVYTGILYGG